MTIATDIALMIQAAAVIVGAIWFLARLDSDLHNVSKRLERIENKLDAHWPVER